MTAQQFFKTGHWTGPFAPTQETDRLGIRIGEGVEIGRNVTIYSGTTIGDGVVIGSNTTIGHRCILRGGVVIGPYAQIDNFVTMGRLSHVEEHCVLHEYSQLGTNCQIGAWSCVAMFVRLPDGFVVPKHYTINRKSSRGGILPMPHAVR